MIRRRRVDLDVDWTRLDQRVSDRSQPSLDLSWLRSVWQSNLRLGAPASLESKVEAVGNGRGFVVITGQQVGLFGGPLYTLYKALTAIELARAIESRTGRVVLPVFWTVGDDSDFGEVSSSWFPNAQGRVQRVRDEEVPPGGTLVGRLPASRQRRLRDEAAAILNGLPHAGDVLRRIDSSLDRAETWAESQSALLHSVLGSDSALVVDGGDRELLSAGRPFLDSALELPLEEDLRKGGDALRDAGLPVAFTSDLARSSFVLRGATRISIDEGYQDGDLIAPNVVLRPLLQDALLPNVSTIGGPSEIAYRRQLGPLYQRLNVPEPIVTPRYRATLVPTLTSSPSRPSSQGATSNSASFRNHLSPNSSPPDEESSLYALAVADPRAFVASAAEARRPDSLRELLDQTRSRVSDELENLGSSASEFDKNLEQVVESARGKIDYQFARIAEESVKKARKQLSAENPALMGLEELVLPKQKPQERVLSWWAPLATDGIDTVESLRRSIAEALTNESSRAASGNGSVEPGIGSADELWQLLGLGPSSGKE